MVLETRLVQKKERRWDFRMGRSMDSTNGSDKRLDWQMDSLREKHWEKSLD
jgi:hypothetical protein